MQYNKLNLAVEGYLLFQEGVLPCKYYYISVTLAASGHIVVLEREQEKLLGS